MTLTMTLQLRKFTNTASRSFKTANNSRLNGRVCDFGTPRRNQALAKTPIKDFWDYFDRDEDRDDDPDCDEGYEEDEEWQ